MAGITTSMATSAKVEFLQAGHCFARPATVTGSATSGVNLITAVSSMAGLVVGMSISGTGIPFATTVLSINASTLTLSQNTTAAISTGTLSLSGDQFMAALFNATPTGTYGAATLNYSQMTADETSGTGYTTGGIALVSAGPIVASTSAVMSFANPSWTTATFTTSGMMIYNASQRLGTPGRCIGVFDFGGVQTVTAASFLITFPPQMLSQSIIEIL